MGHASLHQTSTR